AQHQGAYTPEGCEFEVERSSPLAFYLVNRRGAEHRDLMAAV
ncbi:MAG: hypothetical protein ACI87W_001392, partial [Halieaceae bacterium]